MGEIERIEAIYRGRAIEIKVFAKDGMREIARILADNCESHISFCGERDTKQINKAHTLKQALRLGLLAGQALERSDNPAIIRR